MNLHRDVDYTETETCESSSFLTLPSSIHAGPAYRAQVGTQPGDTIGRYQIDELIGAGGMGEVFAARDLKTGCAVALKLRRCDGGASSTRGRMWREAWALERIRHPNVVAMHDVGVHEGEVFLAMERVGGPTLTAWLSAAPRTWPAVRDVLLAAGRGLAAAHAAGVVHRDFKPNNVMVGEDRVVVVDFGLARSGKHGVGTHPTRFPPSILDVELTVTGDRLGTPRYMAPEQHTCARVGFAADQFAFAACLWAALYGVHPFFASSQDVVLDAILRGPAAPPCGPAVPHWIHAALVRALSVHPDDRWPTLDALLDEIAREQSKRRKPLPPSRPRVAGPHPTMRRRFGTDPCLGHELVRQ